MSQETRANTREFSLSLLRTPLSLLLLMSVLLGVLYPLLTTAISQLVFPSRAGGSLVYADGQTVGSALLGQHFDQPKYFWGRLSATTPAYNTAASSGSNMGLGNPALKEAAAARAQALRKADAQNTQPIPVDLLTASGSGLDPHISLQAAQYQLRRVAKARGKKPEELQPLLERFTEGEWTGAPYVNVLLLNLALDEQAGAKGKN